MPDLSVRPNSFDRELPVRIRLPSISYIVARSWPDSIIGRDNELPWHLRTDLRRFKGITLGHAIIMGRKTYRSIGRPLPGRVNIVLSRISEFDQKDSFWHSDETTLVWAENRESALFFADVISISKGRSECFVIGGSEMYRVFQDLFNKIHLTEVLTGAALVRSLGDAIFDYKIDNRKWQTLENRNIPAGPNDDYPSTYTVLDRRTKYVRYVEAEDYYTEIESKRLWVKRQLNLFDEMNKAAPGKPLSVPYQYQLFEDGTRASD
jgi:dihydrofolate reductase